MVDWKKLLSACGIRALRSFCQGILVMLGENLVAIHTINWLNVLAVAASYAVVSFVSGIATGLPEAPNEDVQE